MNTHALKNLKIISAGAGSGKTYRLTEEMVQLLKSGVRPSGIIATTFTNKAAAELKERVRTKLLEEKESEKADQLTNALIGTVHSLGVKLLKRFAFEAGVSPQVDIIADGDHQLMFNQSLSQVLTPQLISTMNLLSKRLGLTKRGEYDWRREVKMVTDVARANDFSVEVLKNSKKQSADSLLAFLPAASELSRQEAYLQLEQELEKTIAELEAGEDTTKATDTVRKNLQKWLNRLQRKEELDWHEWVKMTKLKTGAKSKGVIIPLVELAKQHERFSFFQEDIRQFIFGIFDIAIAALEEYEAYKKRRGLIDYTDMELHVKRLLDNPSVQEVLMEEVDLLMVDEFQDTSPIQLEIFLKLSQFARHSIWVGDPKQSIYGFRGAEPALMLEIIKQTGGVKKEDIQEFSWRSREGIVYFTNALFCKAFNNIPEEQVALKPKRTETQLETLLDDAQKLLLKNPLIHWHFESESKRKRPPGRPWMENCLAQTIQQLLAAPPLIFPKGEKLPRPLYAGDIAILCRSNIMCSKMAETLNNAGLYAAISRNGLVKTAEARLVLACLKFMLSPSDALSVAEILKLAEGLELETILSNRLEFLTIADEGGIPEWNWASHFPIIEQLIRLRSEVTELSSSEIINLVLEELDLRRVIVRWGNGEHRLANVDELRQLALTYEENCNRLHSAATLGGFLLWISNLEENGLDDQSAGAGPHAVNVLTYHKSKGLEFPLVICHDLENNLRDNIWGVQLISTTDSIDLQNVLGNRWLKYWVNPYSDQIGKTGLEERINASEVKQQAVQEALQEEARVLYVGITRARDYLVLPTRAAPTKWLNRVWHDGDENIPSLDPLMELSQWNWKEQQLQFDIHTYTYPRNFLDTPLPDETIYYLEQRTGKNSDYQPYRIDVDRDVFLGQFKHELKGDRRYANRLDYKEDQSPFLIAKAVKAFMVADRPLTDQTVRLEKAESMLERFGVAELIDTKKLMNHAYFFWQTIHQQFAPIQIFRKYPIRLHRNGRLFENIIDLLLKTEEGWVIIQNSSLDRGKKDQKQKARQLASWFFLAQSALNQTMPEQPIRCLLHFPLRGSWVELKIKKQEPASSK